MSGTTIFINVFAIGLLIFAFIKERAKARKALMTALKSFFSILPIVLVIIVLVGLLIGFVPQSLISRILGEHGGSLGILISASLGSILHIPSLISFPLTASLFESGASVVSVAVFITTLTMIGIVTLPLEIKELGKKMALLRNGISFIAAIVIGLIMGAIL